MTTSLVDNGVNVEALLGAREAFADAPQAAQFQWRATVSLGQRHPQPLRPWRPSSASARSRRTAGRSPSTSTTRCRSPRRTTAITPVEYVLVALGGCLTAGIASIAQQRKIQLRSVQASVRPTMDIQGILGADPDVRNGFSGVRVDYEIDADASPEEIKALVAQSQKRSAVFDILTNPDRRHGRRVDRDAMRSRRC